MGFGKQKRIAKEIPRSCVLQDGVAAVIDPELPVIQLSPEFYDLISDWDPEAANDNYYVTSADFIELHSGIKTFLIRRLVWWAISVCVGMSVLFFVYR